MDNKHRASSLVTTSDHAEPQSSSENAPSSPLSADDLRTPISGPSHVLAEKRRSIENRVVSVKIGDKDGSRSKGKPYPPSDAWAWRKYGQKHIKGSPYPRGYYRCSSFKGCPARKQIERNRVDPATVIITYACEHNHPLPNSKHQHHQAADTSTPSATETATSPAPAPSTATATTSTDAPDDSTYHGETEAELSSFLVDQVNPFGDSTHLEFVADPSILGSLGVEYTWASAMPVETPSLVRPKYGDSEVLAYSIGKEDELLFGDLDELPECSIVFEKRRGGIKRCSTPHIYGNT